MGRLLDEDIVIDVIDNLDYMPSEWVDRGLSLCKDAIKSIPSAQPEQLKAKWEWLSSTYDRIPCEMRFQCSNCHHETITHESDPWEKYCPNCGAKMMRGEQE